jgi:hypothetical protein
MTAPPESPDSQPVPYELTPAAEALLDAESACGEPAEPEAGP